MMIEHWKAITVVSQLGRYYISGLMIMAIALSGCGSSESGSIVKGKVTFEGAPVTSGVVNFKTAEGKPRGGAIQADGSYEFVASPGEYLVLIDSPETYPPGRHDGAPPKPLTPRQVPVKFANFATSGLTASVPADGTEVQIDFKLP